MLPLPLVVMQLITHMLHINILMTNRGNIIQGTHRRKVFLVFSPSVLFLVQTGGMIRLGNIYH